MDELEKVGALERKRQGLGRPNKLYLKKMFLRNSHTVKIKIQKMEKSQLRILILTHTDFLVFTGFEQLKSKSNKTNNNNTNFNNIYLILSGSEETSLWIGYDGFQ